MKIYRIGREIEHDGILKRHLSPTWLRVFYLNLAKLIASSLCGHGNLICETSGKAQSIIHSKTAP